MKRDVFFARLPHYILRSYVDFESSSLPVCLSIPIAIGSTARHPEAFEIRAMKATAEAL
jgi:hypothetical protein